MNSTVEGERKTVTVLFAEVVGTPGSDRSRAAALLDRMIEAVHRH